MAGVLASMAPYIHRFGWWIVAAVVIPEGFGIPLPGETALIAACLGASEGQVSIYPIGVAALLAAIFGNTIGYCLGYYGGRRMVLRYGGRLFITKERLGKTELFFRRYGGLIILFSRFLDVFRQLNGIVAGITRMPFLKFQLYSTLGAILWVGTIVAAAYWLGQWLQEAHPALKNIRYGILAALGAAILVFALRRVRRGAGGAK